jgi:superfamily II DNA helicase RecQ
VPKQKTTEELAGKLKKAGVNAKAYHAGFDTTVRSQTQDDFINDEVPSGLRHDCIWYGNR